MLEYFTYKKVKKHQAEKQEKQSKEVHVQTPVLNDEDENFFQRIVSAEGTPPPLPERPIHLNPEAGDPTDNNAQMVVHDGAEAPAPVEKTKSKDKGKGKEKVNEKDTKKDAKKSNRFSFLSRKKKDDNGLEPRPDVPADEAEKEEDDISKVLDDLNLAAVNNRAFAISKESQELVQMFTLVLKDIVNGVPTAYDDLTHLLDNSNATLSKSYDSLPSFLKKLITQLPEKLKGNLAPELLAVAAEAQGLSAAGASTSAAGGGGIAGAAKRMMTPSGLKELVTKPGAVVSMLKYIMNVLKLRWPAFLGTSVLWSLGLFVLLFVLWYLHKRGRETRLGKETVVDSEGRVVELEDDAMLDGEPGPHNGAATGTNGSAANPTPAPPTQQNGQSATTPSSGYAAQPTGQNEMHERRK